MHSGLTRENLAARKYIPLQYMQEVSASMAPWPYGIDANLWPLVWRIRTIPHTMRVCYEACRSRSLSAPVFAYDRWSGYDAYIITMSIMSTPYPHPDSSLWQRPICKCIVVGICRRAELHFCLLFGIFASGCVLIVITFQQRLGANMWHMHSVSPSRMPDVSYTCIRSGTCHLDLKQLFDKQWRCSLKNCIYKKTCTWTVWSTWTRTQVPLGVLQ